MSTPAASRMSRVDTAWLRMDNDVNLMMIVGVWLLEPSITLQAFRQRVADKLLRYARFRQRVELDAMGAQWVDDSRFDLARHVVAEPLSRRRGQTAQQALQQRCAELAAEPLHPQRPLWQFHLVEQHEAGSAIILRIHHCIADGIALISVMNAITDGGADPPVPVADPDGGSPAGAQAGAADDWLGDAVLRPLTALTVKAIGLSGQGVVKSLDVLSAPAEPLLGSLAGSMDVARAGLQVLQDVAALALMADDSATRLKAGSTDAAPARPSGDKRVAWCEPVPLDEIKVVSKALGASINDVLLACVAGAIGDWLRAQGDDTAGQEIRAMVPVNLRPLEQAWQLGNRFGLAPLLLPVGITNPVERVFAVRQRMAELKESYQPLLAFAVLSAAGLFIKPVQDAVLGLFARKSTAVMTNVPGPAEPLRFCGATLKQSMFWVPASGDIGMGVSVLSYAGGVQFGLITDSALCDEPQAIIDRFEPAFRQLLWLALMLPWSAGA